MVWKEEKIGEPAPEQEVPNQLSLQFGIFQFPLGSLQLAKPPVLGRNFSSKAMLVTPRDHSHMFSSQCLLHEETIHTCFLLNACYTERPLPHVFFSMLATRRDHSHMFSSQCLLHRETTHTCFLLNACYTERPLDYFSSQCLLHRATGPLTHVFFSMGAR